MTGPHRKPPIEPRGKLHSLREGAWISPGDERVEPISGLPPPPPRPRTPTVQQAPAPHSVYPPGPRDTQNMGHEVVNGEFVMRMADRMGAAETKITTLETSVSGVATRVVVLEEAKRATGLEQAEAKGRLSVLTEQANERKETRKTWVPWVLGIAGTLITSAITALVTWLLTRNK